MTLKEWLVVEGRKQTWVAGKLEVTMATVSFWVNGLCRPQARHIRAVEALTDGAVGASDWPESKQRKVEVGAIEITPEAAVG